MSASRALLSPGLLAAAIGLCGAAGGCNETRAAAAVDPAPAVVRRVTNKPPNPDGVAFVLEYHKVSPKETRWGRSVAKFRKDLQDLYDLGFRPVTLNDFLEGRLARPDDSRVAALQDVLSAEQRDSHARPPAELNPQSLVFGSDPGVPDGFLPRGAMPVVITFDDSDRSQFRLRPDGSLDPDCAVGIWAAFAEKHADFPVRATFYVLPDVMWTQHKWWSKKLEMLRKWGCEIGCHTVTHPLLKRLSDDKVKWEIATSVDFIEKLGFHPSTMALPYGVAPKNRSLLRGFDWKGKHYGFKGVVLGGAGPTRQAGAKGFNPYKIQRIQGIDGFLGLSYWLNRVREGRVHPYVAP